MNYSYKLKIRQLAKESKQEPSIRRIRTDYIDNSKKTGSTIRAPLAENKKLFNQNQTSTLKTKKSTGIKTVINKNQGTGSRLTTQPVQKSNYHHQKHTSDKLFNPKKTTTSSTVNNYSFKKKQVRDSVGRTQSKSQINEPKKGQSRYHIQQKIGSGTFGTVHKARDKNTLQVVAIKKVFQDKNYKNRQLQILKLLKHPNVLEMKDSFFTYQSSKEYLNVVMDFYGSNLYQSIHKYSKKNLMPKLKFKVFAYQLFRSLLYLKHLGIAHRDIKPQNILVNQQNLKLVMCDFGSAKQLKHGQPNISYICSRCYRAPQLIFGNTQYTTQIDMWSAGCVIGQMLIIKPLFQGDSNIDQLVQIIKLLGCPTTQQIHQMNPNYDISKFQLPKIGAKGWQKIFPLNQYLGDEFIDLMKNVICFSPIKRYTPIQALQHPFFDELRQKNIYQQLKEQVGLPNLFDFDKTMQISRQERQKLIPKWY